VSETVLRDHRRECAKSGAKGCTEIPSDFGRFEISKFNGFCNLISCVKKRLVFVQAGAGELVGFATEMRKRAERGSAS
jgi:hypothetical protein